MSESTAFRGAVWVAVPPTDDFKRVRALIQKACAHGGLEAVASAENDTALRAVVVDVSPAPAKARQRVVAAIRHARDCELPIVAVAQSLDDVPAELAGQPVIEYAPDTLKALAKPLAVALRERVKSGSGAGKNWLVVAGAVAVVVVAVAVGVAFFVGSPTNDTFDAADIASSSLPFDRELYDATLEKLKAATAPLPSGENAATAYLAAAAVVEDLDDVEFEFETESAFAMGILNAWNSPSPLAWEEDGASIAKPTREAHLAAVREIVGRFDAVLKHLRAGTECARCHWPADWESAVVGGEIDVPLLGILQTAKLALAAAKLELIAGHSAPALAIWADVATMGKRMMLARAAVPFLAGVAVESMVLEQIRWAAHAGFLKTTADFEAAEGVVNALEHDRVPMSEVWETEYVVFVRALHAVKAAPGVKKTLFGMEIGTLALGPEAELGTKLYRQAIAAADLPWTAAKPQLQVIDAEVAGISVETAKVGGGALVAMVMPSLLGMLSQAWEVGAARVGTRAVLGLEQAFVANGEYPATLPAEMSATDPFADAPLKYARVGHSDYRLYSVGRNGRDDGASFAHVDGKPADGVFVPLFDANSDEGKRMGGYPLRTDSPIEWQLRPRGSSGEFKRLDFPPVVPPLSEFRVVIDNHVTQADVTAVAWFPECARVSEIEFHSRDELGDDLLRAVRATFPNVTAVRFRFGDWLTDANVPKLAIFAGISEVGVTSNMELSAGGLPALAGIEGLQRVRFEKCYKLRRAGEAAVRAALPGLSVTMD